MNRRFHPDSVDSQSRFEKNRFNFDFGAASIPTSDLMRYTKNRFNFDFFRFTFSYFTRGDIHAVAGSGCPSIDRKVVNSGKRLRAYIGIDEGNVSQNLRLRLNSLIDSTTSLHAPQILPFRFVYSVSLHARFMLYRFESNEIDSRCALLLTFYRFICFFSDQIIVTDGLNKIQTVEEYLIEIWKAVGMNLEGYNVEFLCLIDSTTSLHAPQILPFRFVYSVSLHARFMLYRFESNEIDSRCALLLTFYRFICFFSDQIIVTDGLNKIQTVEEYLIEIWKAVGMNLEGYNRSELRTGLDIVVATPGRYL
ncbi:hypothetical protein LXL04_023432 [Taraxacum kok-saghyz]